jgi:DNA-binding phage protein
MNKESSIAVASRLSVTYRAVSDLIPDPRNARTHPKRQIDQLKASIREFGFTNPILVDPGGHIIAGHGRLLAARAMGLTEVSTIILSGLSETQKRAGLRREKLYKTFGGKVDPQLGRLLKLFAALNVRFEVVPMQGRPVPSRPKLGRPPKKKIAARSRREALQR